MPKPISRTSATCILKDPDTGETVHIQHGGSILIVEVAHGGGRVEICGPAMIEAVGYAIEDLCASVDDPSCYRGDPPKRDKNRATKDTAKRIEAISVAYQAAAFDGQKVTTRALARYMGNESESGVRKARRYANEHPEMTLDGRGGVSWDRGKSR